MSSGDYYGGGGNGYGGYRQQPYPSQGYQAGGDNYSGSAPPASYGDSLQQQQRPDQRPYSPYSQGSGYGHGAYSSGPTPNGYERPPPGPPPGREYGGNPYDDGYGRPPVGGYEGYQSQGAPPAGEGDRGVLGALAGGAAGGFGGHKMGHGVVGTLGGAVAGSMLEDHFKHKKEEEEQQRRQHEQQLQQQHQHQQQQYHGGPPPPVYSQHPNQGNFAGNFSASSNQISLDRDYDLIASCGSLDGVQRLSSVSLNDCLTNEWGHFKWCRGGNFGGSARNVRLVDGGRVLEAELANGNGGWNRSHIFLDEKISNSNGELRFLG